MATIEEKAGTITKYKVGDKVKIVNYGALIWVSKYLYRSGAVDLPVVHDDGDFIWVDRLPELVGREAVIDGISHNQNDYSLQFIDNGEHVAWFSEQQLENAAP